MRVDRETLVASVVEVPDLHQTQRLLILELGRTADDGLVVTAVHCEHALRVHKSIGLEDGAEVVNQREDVDLEF